MWHVCYQNQCLSVLVHSGCRNKIPQPGQLINNRDLPIGLEAESPRSGWQRGWVLVRAVFWVADGQPLALCPHMLEGGRDLSGASFMRVIIPSRRDQNTSQRPRLLITSPLLVRIFNVNFEKTQIFSVQYLPYRKHRKTGPGGFRE